MEDTEDIKILQKKIYDYIEYKDEEYQTFILNKIERFDTFRKCLARFNSARDRLVNLSFILDECYGDDPNRIVMCQLMAKCDEKYKVNAVYNDLSEDDQKLVLKYI